MSAFVGVVTFGATLDSLITEEQLVGALCKLRKGPIEVRRTDNALVVQRTSAINGREAAAPLASGHDGFLFAADARLDNRAELAAALAVPAGELARTADTELIFRMHRRWGGAGVARCLGAFAFALWDQSQNRLILGRDCLGDRALFFHKARGFVAFATTLGALFALPCVPRKLDEIALANFLAVNLREPRRTFYLGVERVPSRTLVTIGRNAITHDHYWSPDFSGRQHYRRHAEYVEHARELLDRAVIAATADCSDVAIFTSGGLDSSGVAATAALLGRAERITCYTLVPPTNLKIDVGPFRYLDDRKKIGALAELHPALRTRFFTVGKPHPYEEDPDRFFALANVPVLGPAVFGEISYLHDCVNAAGHQLVLGGGGGNFGLSWDGQFSLLASLRSMHWGLFARDLAALTREYGSLTRVFGREVMMRAMPDGIRRLISRCRGRDPDSSARYSALNAAFIIESGLVQRWREQSFDPWFGVKGWQPARHRAYHLFDYNQMGHDWRAITKEIHGHEMRNPLADRRLLEFALTVPEQMYRRDGIPRSFARDVLADRLPREILDDPKRGTNGVTWFRRLNSRRQEVIDELDNIEASPLGRRLLDVARLKRIADQWPADENAAELRGQEFKVVLSRGVHIGRFIRWVEGENA